MDLEKNNKRSTEYLIVGAGAAGCTLGYLLKKAGADVLVLERQDEANRERLCAGILEGRSEQAFVEIFEQTLDAAGLFPMRLDHLSLRHAGFVLNRMVKGREVLDNEIVADVRKKNLGSSFSSFFKSGGKVIAKRILCQAVGYDRGKDFAFRSVPRKQLDDYIRNQYLSQDGLLLDRTVVRSIDEEQGIAECIDLRTKEIFGVRFANVIGADGAASAVRRLTSGKAQNVSLALECPVPLMSRDLIIQLETGAIGYCWYIPRGKDATVGCCYHDLEQDAVRICRQRLSDFCATIGVALPDKIPGALLPKGNDVLLQPGKHSFLVGDAAGLIDAFTGGGIHYALLSAQALAKSITGGPPYAEAMKPHLAFIKKNVENVEKYYRVAWSVIDSFGKRL